jgi:GT2 family glycosyltransferase
VVVATRNRRDSLLEVLARLEALPERPAVVVVDNGSTDRTADAVRGAHPEVTVVETGRNLGAGARTLGAERAQTPFVAFADDDSWWAPGALAEAVRLLEAHPRLAVVAARVLVGPDEADDPVCVAMAASPLGRDGRLPGPFVLGFVACGAVVRRDAFLSVGGFRERLGVGGEEALLAIDLARQGWELVYAPGVVAHHHPSAVRDVARRRRVELRNALWVAWLRRPAARALAATWRLTRRAPADRAHREALREALRGLPWALRSRRRVPDGLERALAKLEE